ncbi:MAG: DoxX family membrane protein [Bacteroidales bacterium]|nr:DoxX family membrane protein [Bacteroidales bacterium]
MEKTGNKLTTAGLYWMVVLRVVIGWHFLYEGLVKLVNPNWSSVGFLLDSQGMFKGVFESMAANPSALAVVDFMNIWGLIAIGLGLILGLLSRISLWSGIVLLAMYYLSHPPFVGLKYAMPMEGSYLVVNKILIELVALVVLLYFPTSRRIGLDRLIFRK